MPSVKELLRQRHQHLLDIERSEFRRLQSARSNRKAVGPAVIAYEAARLARLRAENLIRGELGLEPVPEVANVNAPQGIVRRRTK